MKKITFFDLAKDAEGDDFEIMHQETGLLPVHDGETIYISQGLNKLGLGRTMYVVRKVKLIMLKERDGKRTIFQRVLVDPYDTVKR